MLKSLLYSLLVVFLFVGCATNKIDNKTTDVKSQDYKIGENMIEAFKNNDAKLFISMLPEDIQKKFGEMEFKLARAEVINPMGEIVSYEYLTTLNAPIVRPLIWKITFNRKSQTGKVIEQQSLFRVIIGTIDNKPQILSFGFI